MQKILLLQFDTDPQGQARRVLLKSVPADLVEGEPQWPGFFDVVTAQRPDVIVIGCSRLARNGIEAARYLNEGFNTRNIPVILVDVDPRDAENARTSAPLATIVAQSALAQAVNDTLAARA